MYAIKRSFLDRRSGKERRKTISLPHFLYKGPERRFLQDRRSIEERREGWVRISRWSSVHLAGLKLAKYLIA